MTLYSFAIDVHDPVAIFACVHNRPYSLFFDSAHRSHQDSRYSYVLFDPIETIEATGNRVCVSNEDQTLCYKGDPFTAVRERLESRPFLKKAVPNLPPFQGGAAGYFGYNLVRTQESLPKKNEKPSSKPDMQIGLYDQIIAFDHIEEKAFFMVRSKNERRARQRYESFGELLQKEKKQIAKQQDHSVEWVATKSPNEYKTDIQKIIDYIYAGDIFQANLSQRFETKITADFDSFAHYCHLRTINEAPFAAYMNFGNRKLASCSPERFLQVKDRHVKTCPIKGTRPHLENPEQDRAIRRELAANVKERSENIMIVDLLRNDISRSCEDHSIDVPKLCQLQTFPGVHHLVSEIVGTLRADKHALDLLRRCFPGGSITGAPKIRAMEIIEELELAPRGPYCGSMGLIGFDGYMDSNIAIRTLVYDDDTISLNVGGGITAESSPEAEYRETLDKAQKIFDSFAQNQKSRKAA
ncbi:MAG: aminodeoxychorismate synthase component I [Rhodospirillales bacterium]|nr:aminodeoxychorismate synthase component I [Rhodospirillales bacterium]